MGKGVHADGGGERARHGEGELVIDYDGAGLQRCGEHHHFHVLRGIGDDGDLAARVSLRDGRVRVR